MGLAHGRSSQGPRRLTCGGCSHRGARQAAGDRRADPEADSEREDIAEVFAHYFAPAPPARLALADYPHLAGDIETLAHYLGAALASRARGVNALIYGPSGTGKTELARALAGALGMTLYEVSAEDEDGDTSDGRERLRAFRLCQSVLRSGAGQLVLFDEIEDVFPEDGAHAARYRREAAPPKGWLTHMLEQNAVPALWLSNEVAHIDPALLRRFDYVLKAPIPPRSVRRAILEAELGGMAVGVPWMGRMAETEHLAPADIARARKVGALIAGPEAAANEARLEAVLRGSLEVRGHSLAPARAALGTLPFRLEYCETSSMGSMRRHCAASMKVEYRYLGRAQISALFCEFAGLGGENVPGAFRARLERLANLTPGDFAAVARRTAILGEPLDAERLIAALEAECALKPEGRRRPMGFVA